MFYNIIPLDILPKFEYTYMHLWSLESRNHLYLYSFTKNMPSILLDFPRKKKYLEKDGLKVDG